MSNVTLHGYPVKVGDMVWSIEFGECDVKEVFDCYFTFTSPNYKTIFISDCHHENTIFWQPIDPTAIEAAKVKPKEPKYEWQWLYIDVIGHAETTAFYPDGIKPELNVRFKLISRIEESKREVKP